MTKWAVFCFLLFAFFASSPAFAFNAHQPFDISADMIDYVDVSQEITAEGHVVVVQTSSTLSADYMRYDRVAQKLEARGHVILHDKGSILAGDFMHYDLVTETGDVQNAKGYGNPWLMQADSWEKKMDYYVGRTASFTNCDLIDPHYHFRSSRVHLVPDRMFWAWNNKFFVDHNQVFYSPFVYKDLDKRRVVFQAQPGNDSVNGSFAKTITTIRFTDFVYDKFLFDHYSVAGNGIGNEFDYQSGSKLKGSLFGYYINPQTNPALTGAPAVPQYSFRSYHFEQINPTLSLQANANLRKNVSFNNLYFAQDTNQAVSDITSSVALTKATKNLSQRVVVERLDAPDPTDTGPFATTHLQSASLPRYEFTTYQKPLWNSPVSSAPIVSSASFIGPRIPFIGPMLSTGTSLSPPKQHIGPVFYTMNGTMGQFYERADDRTHSKGTGSVIFNNTIPLGKTWSLTPGITPQLNWQDKFDPPPSAVTVISTDTNSLSPTPPPSIALGQFLGFQGRIGTSDSLRWRESSDVTVDTVYSLTERLTPNATALDRSQDDGGLETHHVTSLVNWRPSRTILMRTFSGFDLRRIANETDYAYTQRKIDPWTSELTLQPKRSNFDYFFRYQLAYYPVRTSLWEADGHYHGPFRSIFELGVLYNSAQPGVLTVNNRVGFFFSPGWRADVTINALSPNSTVGNLRDASIVYDEFIITRDLHCWQAQFIYRSQPPYGRSYSLLFDLKLGASDAKKISDQDLESQFYPWRARPYAS